MVAIAITSFLILFTAAVLNIIERQQQGGWKGK